MDLTPKSDYFSWNTKNKNCLENNISTIMWLNKLKKIRPLICNIFDIILLTNKIKYAKVSILWTNDLNITRINKKHRNFDKPTNILSFPARFDEDEKIFLGDLVLSYEIIHKEIKETNVSFENYISHLIVHGILHLLGYEHNTEENATYMENSEIAILSKFGIPNPYI